MKVYRKLILNNLNEVVYFGIADSNDEVLEVQALRYKVYKKKGYISETSIGPFESDSYDTGNVSTYFIAKYNNQLIGTIRLIKSDPLPTELAFHFVEPEDIRLIPRKNRAELGRFIIVPPKNHDYFPRRLVMLFLIDVLSQYGLDTKIEGGYSFVKKSLFQKLIKLHLPIGKIDKYSQTYPKDGVLYNYFSQQQDPVIPIYYETVKFKNFSDKLIRKSKIFSLIDDVQIKVNNNLYTMFLRKLNIL